MYIVFVYRHWDEIEKWWTVTNMLQRIKAEDMEKYIKEAQKLSELNNEF